MVTSDPALRSRRPAYLSELFDILAARGRRLWRRGEVDAATIPDLCELGDALLSRRGEASGVAIAQELLAAFEVADDDTRLAFLQNLANRFGPDPGAVKAALERLLQYPEDMQAMEALHSASEPLRQELLRRLNLAPGGTAGLVRMRERLRRHLTDIPALRSVDQDFAHLFSSWFNRGFLVLRRIDWTTPANILEKIIRYEAVHAIQNWDDLKNRLQPTDRRCYSFFHPQLGDEPLIFVEVALTKEIPGDVATLLDVGRRPISAEDANTAVFYSISNTQRGLAGVSFGNFLIKQVVEELKAELPNVKTFVTLSPVPTFGAWLERHRKDEASELIDTAQRAIFCELDNPGWHKNPAVVDALRGPLLAAAATYFLHARDRKGRIVDPVARFHLGNGARLDRLNLLGDLSANGLKQSHGLMVNYLYDLSQIETNHEGFAERGLVAAADSVKRALPAGKRS